MAYSTQKNFFRVAFMNERPEAQCLPLEGVKLKTYASTLDERAWSSSKEQQSQYLMDLVACRMYPNESGDGLRSVQGQCDPCGSSATAVSVDGVVPAIGGSSLTHSTVGEITKLERLVTENEDLKHQLQVSKETLRILKEENKTIDAILKNEHIPEMCCCFKNKIEQLKSSSKIDKNDENELLKILDSQYKRDKAYKVMEAQNNYLRRLANKLSEQSRLCTIPLEPEKSTDVGYLQCTVDKLRKEVKVLRSLQDQELKTETSSERIQDGCTPSDNDAGNINKILTERNALGDKCKQFAAIEGKIVQWKHHSEQLQSIRSEACSVLKKKDEQLQDYREEIEELQFKIKRLEKCCMMKDQKEESLCESIDCLKDENRCLKGELCRCRCELKKITMLQAQVQYMQEELCEKNCIISQYDAQYQQLLIQSGRLLKLKSECGKLMITLLGVVEGLRKKAPVDIRGLQDVDSQTHIEELTTSTRATLNHISKELETSKSDLQLERQKSQNAVAQLAKKELENRELRESLNRTSIAVKRSFQSLNIDPKVGEDCAAQVDQLNGIIADLKKQNVDNEHQNDQLNEALKNCESTIKIQQDQIKELSEKTANLESALHSSKADLEEANKLVKDISSVQERNDSLKSVLGAAEQKESDDCKKELEEQRNNNITLEEQIKNLQTALDKAKNDLSTKADLKKQLELEMKKYSVLLEENKNLLISLEKERGGKPSGSNDATPSGNEAGSNSKSNSGPQDVAAIRPSASPVDLKQGKKSNAKLAQLRDHYEKEIEGHRMSNDVLRSSLTKLTNKMQSRSAVDFEREFRLILDTFIEEICKWRCERTCRRLTKLQEICKKILEMGIEYLTYKELVYLHQQMSEAALRLRPKLALQYNAGKELKCCKCSEYLCYVPTIPKENERKLLEKMAALERDIHSAREHLRKLKEGEGARFSDAESLDLETIRANTFRQNCAIKTDASVRLGLSQRHFVIQEDKEAPTKDRF